MRRSARRPRGFGSTRTALERGTPSKFRASGFVHWFRADLGITIGTGISAAGDQSGSGNGLTQGTGSAQPTQVLNAYNGKPCARYVSASSQVLSKSNTNLFGAGAYTIFGAWVRAVAAVNQGIYGCTNATGVTMFTDGNKRSILHAGVAAHDSAVDMSTSALELWVAIRPAATVPSLYVNGANDPVGGAAPGMTDPGGTAFLALGAYAPAGALASFFDGDVCEAGSFTSDVSLSVMTRISHYMGARYGIAA